MIFSSDYNADFYKGVVPQSRGNSTNSYIETDYINALLDSALIRFYENSIKIANLEDLGKSCHTLYMENRLILAVLKFYATAFPCDNFDKPVECLNSLGFTRSVKTFDYFNRFSFLLLDEDNYRLLADGRRLLEGEGTYFEDALVSCSCDTQPGIYIQTDNGQIVPINTYPIDTENYG